MKTKGQFGQMFLTFFLVLSILLGLGTQVNAAGLKDKTIAGVGVSGNVTVPESSIMAVIKLKAGDPFNDETIQQDMQAIYGMGSFYDVQAHFTEEPQGIKVIYTVVEKTPVKDIVFIGNTKVSAETLQPLVAAIKGNVVDNQVLKSKTQSIEQYYHDQGYILARVSNVTIDKDGILSVFIDEGMVEGIVVKGNEKTKTHVITREMKLKVGEPFNSKAAKRSLQKIYNLGFFEDVNIKLLPGREPHAVVVEIDVKEQRTGTFSIGGSYSQTDGMGVNVGIGDKNFGGSGNSINLNFQHGIDSIAGTGWDVSYTDPWIDDKETSFSFDFFNTTNEWNDYGLNGDNTALRSTYYRKSRGFNVTLGRPQGEYVKNYITFTDRKDLYQQYVSGPINYLEGNTTASDYNSQYNSQYLSDNFGTVHSVTLSRVYDTRDNVFDATEGKRVSLTGEFAGSVFGGQFNYDKYTFDGRQYFKVGSKQTLAVRLTSGYSLGNVPDSSKFVVGGPDTLRGYNDEEFKGEKMFTATVEYRYPIAKKVVGVLFTDAGNAWDGPGYSLGGLKHSVGVGLRMITPLGPVRLDYGHGTEGNKFDFSFGGQF